MDTNFIVVTADLKVESGPQMLYMAEQKPMRGSRNGYTSSIMAVRIRPAGSPVDWAPSEGKGAITL
jgi:hypothetical protein